MDWGNLFRSVGQWAQSENGRRTIIGVGSAAAATIIATTIVSNYKDNVYKKLMKKHDEETARRLSEEFERKLSMLKRQYGRNEDSLRNVIRNLCNEMGIDPNDVLN